MGRTVAVYLVPSRAAVADQTELNPRILVIRRGSHGALMTCHYLDLIRFGPCWLVAAWATATYDAKQFVLHYDGI